MERNDHSPLHAASNWRLRHASRTNLSTRRRTRTRSARNGQGVCVQAGPDTLTVTCWPRDLVTVVSDEGWWRSSALPRRDSLLFRFEGSCFLLTLPLLRSSRWVLRSVWRHTTSITTAINTTPTSNLHFRLPPPVSHHPPALEG